MWKRTGAAPFSIMATYQLAPGVTAASLPDIRGVSIVISSTVNGGTYTTTDPIVENLIDDTLRMNPTFPLTKV